MATKALRRSDQFFEEKAQFGRLRLAGLVVTLVGFAYALQSIAMYYALGAQRTEVSNAITVEFAARFAEPVLLWAVLTVVFYLAAKLLGARVRFGRLLKLTGIGFIPFVLTGLAWSVGYYLSFRDLTVPEVRVGVLASEREALAALSADVTGDPELVGATVVGCLFALTAIYFWGLAIDYSSDIDSRRTSWLIAAIPAVAYVLYSVMGVL